jgi:hypothetical protein
MINMKLQLIRDMKQLVNYVTVNRSETAVTDSKIQNHEVHGMFSCDSTTTSLAPWLLGGKALE